jgi:site-specific DNA-methyltransferase (adenine-specific)
LVEHHEGAPVLVKIQKDTETLKQARELLTKAMIVKASKMGFLIETQITLEEAKADAELSFESKSEDLTIFMLETIELKLKRSIGGHDFKLRDFKTKSTRGSG